MVRPFTTSVPTLEFERFSVSSCSLSDPSLNNIASPAFLDQKTAEIDEAINKKQRLIELLKEQKAILINQAVTKGLNPNVPMRDSRCGVDWGSAGTLGGFASDKIR